MNTSRPAVRFSLIVAQVFVAASLLAAAVVTPRSAVDTQVEAVVGGHPVPRLPADRTTALTITPLYDDPTVIHDDDLLMVLRKLRPIFEPHHLSPNHVEHALRAWSINATFRDPLAMSGEQMTDFLLDHGKFLASWDDRTAPLLQTTDAGIEIHWGSDPGASVHHDHLLASLSESGVPLDRAVYTPGREARTFHDVLNESLVNFQLDERETEWSALAYALWLPPAKSWKNRDGREITFDMLADRLLRGHQRFGVCSGTHRVYSAMVLLRVDDDYSILSPEMRARVYAHLESVRDRIMVCQFPDGHWPSNWSEGKSSLEFPVDDALSKQVIATGHHLEWLAIAPPDLHPPREQVRKAAAWLVSTVADQSDEDIKKSFTFFSHVANALALWRKSSPHVVWDRHLKDTPALEDTRHAEAADAALPANVPVAPPSEK